MTSSPSKNKSKEVVEVEEFVPFDPWNPVLKNSPSLQADGEQKKYLKAVLDICCSDSAFAKKAYDAIQYILTGLIPDPPTPPVLDSISPTTTVVGVPVTVVFTGSGFVDGAVIFANNVSHPATFVSETEISFSPDVTVPVVLQLYVQNPNQLATTIKIFDITAVTLLSTSSKETAYQKEVKAFEERKK